MSFTNSWTISSSNDFQANQQHPQRRSFFSQTALLWFEGLPDLSPVLPGAPMLVVGAARLVPSAPRCSQACHQSSQTCFRRSQVLPGAPKVLSGALRCFQTYHSHSHGTPVAVIRHPRYSEGRQECPPRVWYSPQIDASKFTLHILPDTAGGFQWLKYILLMYRLDSGSETMLRIQIKQLLFEGGSHSYNMDKNKLLFTWMEFVHLIIHQFFFPANSLGSQPTTSQCFQPLALQILVLAHRNSFYASQIPLVSHPNRPSVAWSLSRHIASNSGDPCQSGSQCSQSFPTLSNHGLSSPKHISAMICTSEILVHLLGPCAVLLYFISTPVPSVLVPLCWDGYMSVPEGTPIILSTLPSPLPFSGLCHWDEQFPISVGTPIGKATHLTIWYWGFALWLILLNSHTCVWSSSARIGPSPFCNMFCTSHISASPRVQTILCSVKCCSIIIPGFQSWWWFSILFDASLSSSVCFLFSPWNSLFEYLLLPSGCFSCQTE